jgi:ABC-type sugar transport system substrate-binding protein/DNA-binding CsgD family transcriptional regulator
MEYLDDASQQGIRAQLSERERDILRLMAAGLSNQEIADRLFLALTTIKWYIRQINDKLDTHTRTQTVARAHQLNLVGESDAEKVALAADREPPENPYKGLRAFQESDAADFFGREALSQRLLVRLSETDEAVRFLAVVGPSGSGKSSVVQAGLIPALRQGKLPGSENWLIAEMLPGAHPLEELEIALLRVAAHRQSSLMEQLRRDERGLLRAARLALPVETSPLLLVIDQFEEVFTLVEGEAERRQFLDLLTAAATDARSPVRVVITLRADFYDRPLLYGTFGELIHQCSEVVLPLTAEELERAITRPAARVGVALETGLATAIVTEVNQQPGALPLLQYALTELFDSCEGSTLTLDAYRAIGGVTGALARRAETLYGELDAAGQEAARQMSLRLVTLGEGVEDTRRRVLLAELLSLGSDPAAMDDLVQTFASYRLLTLDRDPATDGATVEVAHEAILREWQRLREWLNESRDEIRLQRQLAAMAVEWRSAKQDASFLLRGARLEQFEVWAGETKLALTPDEREYLDASLAEHERQTLAEQARQEREARLERRSRNFLRGLVAVLLLATLGAFGLTGVAVNQSQAAQTARDQAQSEALASAAQLQLNEGNVEQAIALAKAAQQIGNTPSELAQHVLDEAAYTPGTQRIFQEVNSLAPAALAIPQRHLTFVMVSHLGPGHSFAAPIIKGMEDACSFLEVACQWVSEPDFDTSEQQMADHWDKALALNPDGIGTTLVSPDAIRSRAQQAAQRGIPVIAFNVASGSDPDHTLPLLLFIGSNEFVAGQTNARRVFSEAKADGVTIKRGVCANQERTNPAVAARCTGVKSVFEEEGVPLDQLPISGDQSNGLDVAIETMASQLADYFKIHPDTNAIFMLGPSPASALHLYLQRAGLKPRQLYATTHDTSDEIFQMIRGGYLLQTIDQQPYMQGFQTIMSLYLYRQYGLRPSGFINTSSVVDQSNVDLVTQLVAAGYR